MRLAAVGEVEDHRVIEHRSAAFRNTLQSRDDAFHQRHVVRAGTAANFFGTEPGYRLSVADVMHVDLRAFNAGNPRVVVAQLVDSERDNVGQPRDQGTKQDLRVPFLTLKRADLAIHELCVEFRNMTANPVGHRVDLPIPFANRLDGIRVALNLRLLESGKIAGGRSLIPSNEFHNLAVKQVLRLSGLVRRNRLEQLLQRDPR